MTDNAAYTYHKEERTPALSSSIIKILATKSPRHAWERHPLLNPDYREETSDTFDYGTAAHALFLEGDESKLVVVEADDWRKKEARAAREQARADRKTPILARQLATVRKMVQGAHRFVLESGFPRLMQDGISEYKIRWHEGESLCMAKIDRMNPAMMMDYKSTNDASPEAFSRTIARFGYDIQARFYQRGVRIAEGREYPFLFLAQEADPPYACSWHALAPSMAEIADMRIERAIRTWQACMASGKWPAYSNAIHYAEAPHWMLEEAEQIASGGAA